MMGQFGSALAQSGTPATDAIGYIAQVAAVMLPSDPVQDYANCQVSCIAIRDTAIIDSVNMVYNFEIFDPNNPNDPHPKRTPDKGFTNAAFGTTDKGEHGFMSAEAAKAISIGHGKQLQCILIYNWATGDTNRMHARVDVHYH
jgi:hypothetical protein